MPYTHLTRAQLRTELAERLGDPNNVFWGATELNLYLNEALRAWGAATEFWRGRDTFNTSAGVAFYALQTSLSGSLLAFSLTDRDLIEYIQYHLLEAATSQAAWNGTEMFTLAEVAQALQQRRNNFLVETGQVLTRTTPAMPASPTARVDLSDTIIDLRRLNWIAPSGANPNSHLWREDEWSVQSLNPSFLSATGIPIVYTLLGSQPVQILVGPQPNATGTLEIISVNTGAAFAPQSSATAVGVFENFAHVVKWGAVADMLAGEGQEADPVRRAIAERRWREGVELVKLQGVIYYAQIGSTAVSPVALHEMDALDTNWQNKTQAAPTQMALAGKNIVAFNAVPSGATTITLDVARNAPIPANDAANVEIGREDITALLDYAEFLALYKVGGTELLEAEQRLMRRFYGHAAVYNGRIRASAVFAETVFGQSSREEKERPRVLQSEEVS